MCMCICIYMSIYTYIYMYIYNYICIYIYVYHLTNIETQRIAQFEEKHHLQKHKTWKYRNHYGIRRMCIYIYMACRCIYHVETVRP